MVGLYVVSDMFMASHVKCDANSDMFFMALNDSDMFEKSGLTDWHVEHWMMCQYMKSDTFNMAWQFIWYWQ